MLFTIYDPKGEKFEVGPTIAKRLIIDAGWTISPPKEVKVEVIPVQEEPEDLT